MRKIEAQMVSIIQDCLRNPDSQGRRLGSTVVEQIHHGVAWTPGYFREIKVSLHGNLIATFEPGINRVALYTQGWRSATTKSRLNAMLVEFCKCSIYQSNFDWFVTQGSADPVEFDEGMELKIYPVY
jgi:hypothetical protein